MLYVIIEKIFFKRLSSETKKVTLAHRLIQAGFKTIHL
jgi:hypothetical protein